MADVIFFDVNGTLVERDARTDLAYKVAANRLLSVENSMEGVDNSARSDHDVFKEILRNHSVRYTDRIWNKFLALYEEALDQSIKTDIWRENVDSRAFLQKLEKTDHVLSLITGELSIGAEKKLKKIGYWKYFVGGGFGEHGIKRFDIASFALERIHNEFDKTYDNIYVIGDTVLDIQTARHIGAKIISITTGSHSREKLKKENPDYLIDRFEEIYDLFL